MSEPVRVGILGLTHDHIWGNLGRPERVCTRTSGRGGGPQRGAAGARFATSTDVPIRIESYDEMLTKVELDAVYIYGGQRDGGGAEP